ncbi:MAG TPA: hypothetical protein VF042_00740 [Gemmatimonadaceae bacterium]
MTATIRVLIFSFATATIFSARPAAALSCSVPSNASTGILAKYKWLATTTDPVVVAHRQAKGLFALAATEVTLVTDSVVCRQAVSAYNGALAPDSITTTQLHVIRFGPTRYVVFDELRKAGEWIISFVFTSSFAQVLSRGSE